MINVSNLSLQAADEAGILDNFLLDLFLRPEVCEGVDDDTEDEVEDDDDDHEEEEHVVDEAEGEDGLGAGGRPQHVTDPASVPQTLHNTVRCYDDMK